MQMKYWKTLDETAKIIKPTKIAKEEIESLIKWTSS